MNTTQKTHRCKACKEYKDRTDENFARASMTRDGLSNTCLVCETEHRKAKTAEYKAKAFERAREKQANKALSVVQVQQSKTKINHFSKKGKIAHDELTEIKKQIRATAEDMNTRFCQGCGNGSVALDCSHILSVGQRPDLANDKDNISLLCRCCHVKHESLHIPFMIQLNCFESDLKYLYENDQQKFHKVFFKLLDYIEANPSDKKAEKILKNLEKQENY